MRGFLNYIFLSNPVREYLIVIAIILAALLFKRFLSRSIAGILHRGVNRLSKNIDKQTFVNLVITPLELFIVILISVLAMDRLIFPLAFNATIYKVSIAVIIETFVIIILIIAFIWLLLRIIDFIAMILEQKANLTPDLADNQLIVFFKDFFKVLIVILGILLILKFGFRFKIGNLITALSIGGAALALATRESLENLIASFIIFFDKPFITGDLVKVQNVSGTVEKIGLRSTRIRTDQKTYVSVPNKQMVDSILDNLTLRTHRRGFILLELKAQTSNKNIHEFIEAIRNLLSGKSEINSHSVFLADITRNVFQVSVEYFTAPVSIEDFNMLRQQVNLDTIRMMEEMKINLASREFDQASVTSSN